MVIGPRVVRLAAGETEGKRGPGGPAGAQAPAHTSLVPSYFPPSSAWLPLLAAGQQ